MAALGNHTVEVIDLRGGKVIHTIKVFMNHRAWSIFPLIIQFLSQMVDLGLQFFDATTW